MKLEGKTRPELWVILGLVVVTCLVYGRVSGFQFINYDDPVYVYVNPHVLSGLTWQGVAWAFTHFAVANWHPVTWLSHMADVSLFGPSPAMPHVMNLVLHVLNAILLFLVLRNLTRALWPSALVAALFAVHPLHVESVAWVAERKDVLSMFLGLLSLYAYERYARTGSRRAIAGAWVACALSLMAKPMLVSLPLLMVLLDYWPLERLRPFSWKVLGRLLKEKWPFFLLSLGSCVVTVLAQRSGRALVGLENLGLGNRFLNAALSYGRYLAHMVWPAHMVILYPFPPPGTLVRNAVISGLAMGGIFIAAIWNRVRRPYLLMGFLWYLLSLVPVIGIVQVGRQAMADRYTYLPLVGPFIAIVWLGAELSDRWRLPERLQASLSLAIVAILMVIAYRQVGYWKDSASLFRHCLDTPGAGGPVPYVNLGFAYLETGRYSEALEEFTAASKVSPREYLAHELRGDALRKLGRNPEALDAYAEALKRNPRAYPSAFQAARLLSDAGRNEEALALYRRFLFLESYRLSSEMDTAQQRKLSQDTRLVVGLTLKKLGRMDEAAAAFMDALGYEPGNPEILLNLGIVLGAAGKRAEALLALERAVALAPRQAITHSNLGCELARSNHYPAALREFHRALELDPANRQAMDGLLQTQGRNAGPVGAK